LLVPLVIEQLFGLRTNTITNPTRLSSSSHPTQVPLALTPLSKRRLQERCQQMANTQALRERSLFSLFFFYRTPTAQNTNSIPSLSSLCESVPISEGKIECDCVRPLSRPIQTLSTPWLEDGVLSPPLPTFGSLCVRTPLRFVCARIQEDTHRVESSR